MKKYLISKIPIMIEVNKCCFCLPLWPGIIIFGITNIVMSLVALICLVITTELQKMQITNNDSVEGVTATVLFGILGMGILLNVFLLFAGKQKDISMLRLYSYYLVGTTLAALIPTIILLSLQRFYDVGAAFLAIGVQCYVILLVRSEVVNLENKEIEKTLEQAEQSRDAVICVPEDETLI